LLSQTTDRSLEDLDRFFTENQNVLVFRDADAVSSKRPLRYIEKEQDEVRRHSSISPQIAKDAAARHRANVLERERSGEDKGSIDGEIEKGSLEYHE
jgi:hypothetical protein